MLLLNVKGSKQSGQAISGCGLKQTCDFWCGPLNMMFWNLYRTFKARFPLTTQSKDMRCGLCQ